MKRFLLALLLCAACKHSTSSSSTSHSETSTVTDSTSTESGATTTTTTVQTAPGETVTTIDEYDPPAKEEAAPEQEPPQVDAKAGATLASKVPTMPRRGPLRKETVIDNKQGGSTATTAQQASTQAQGATETRAQGKVDTKAQAQSESKPAASCVSLGWLWGLGMIGVALMAWRLLRKV